MYIYELTPIAKRRQKKMVDVSLESVHFKELLYTPFILLILFKETFVYTRSERALRGPTLKGKVKNFCRQKGHGFIIPEEQEKPLIFVHISE